MPDNKNDQRPKIQTSGYNGSEPTSDYRMEVDGRANTHGEICEYLYDNSNEKY